MCPELDVASIAKETTLDGVETKVDTVDGNVDDVEAKVGVIEGKIDTIDGIVDSIKTTTDSTLVEVVEIEHHLHNYSYWFGLAAVPNAEVHTADRCNQAAPFVLTTGNNNFGEWVQIFGSSDTPIKAGYTKYDSHRIRTVAVSDSGTYTIQFASGESAGLAAKVTANTLTEFVTQRDSSSVQSVVADILDIRHPAGEKLWARAAVRGANAKTISFYIGLHEYLV